MLAHAVIGCLLAVACAARFAAAQTTAAWTWVGGNNTIYQPGTYGTLGTPAPGNLPPGRWSAATWIDKSGNLWLFGGQGYNAATTEIGTSLNDLWEYSPTANEWTWMGGSSALPQSTDGYPGVYGTLGVPAQGDLPGSRYGAASWVDANGNLWLFGGMGNDASGNGGWLNDLWEYSPSTKEWTWMGGSDEANQPGSYGILGTPAPGNLPGGRGGAAIWMDAAGNVWLFGGDGSDANGTDGNLNDLWKFDAASKQWAWESGDDTVPETNGGQAGMYGTLGVPAAGNLPGGRVPAATWMDANENFWLFGGEGFDENDTGAPLNDLWKFNPGSMEWTWMGGGDASAGCTTYNPGLVLCAGQPGEYGEMGTAGQGNVPGGRENSANWTDANGNFWFFGGQGDDSESNDGNLNDLWEYSPATNEWTWMSGNATEAGCELLPEGQTFCKGQPGEYGTLGVPGPGNDPGARFGAAAWMDKQGNFWLFGGYGADNAGRDMGTLNDLWEYRQSTNALPAAATPTFSLAAGKYSSSQSVTISDATPGATIYYTTDGSAPSTSSTVYSGPIAVATPTGAIVETINAIAAADGYSNSTMASATYTVSIPADYSLSVSPASLTVASGQSGTVTVTVKPINGFNAVVGFSCSGLPSGYSCGFSPATVTPQTGPVSTTLTVSASPATVAGLDPNHGFGHGSGHGSGPLLPVSALAGAICCFGWKRRRSARWMAMFLAACCIGMSLLCGCGGTAASEPISATVTVNASDGPFLLHSTSFTLTID